VSPLWQGDLVLEEEYQPRRSLPRALRPAEAVEAPFSYEIRPAVEGDLPGIREIYNLYVANSTVTFDEKAKTLREWRATFAKATKLNMPVLVAESPTGHLLGYAMVLPWQSKAAYRFTVEDSIYLGPASTGKGLGKALLDALIEACRDAGIREIIAVIADKGAEASIHLHESFGFKEVGRMGRVGFKFDRWLGTVMLQKSLKKRPRAR
jgi:L-amino acid N-acyltransferase YncA